MRRIFIFLVVSFVFYSCAKEEANITAPKTPIVNAINYYPGNVGSQFLYKVEQIDTVSDVADSLMTNSVTFDSTVIYNGVEYIVQNTALPLNGAALPLKLLLRRTDAGVYVTIDTSGIYLLFADSLLQNVTINADPEANIFSYPLFDGKIWPAYKFNVAIGAFELSLIDVQAHYLGTENLDLGPLGTVPTEKIVFKIDIKIPNPDNPVEFSQVKTDINAWFAKDIGLVRSEMNPSALASLAGTEPVIDSSLFVRQTLISYDIK